MISSLSAFNIQTPKQLGENAHTEYSWSSSLQEKILQLHFQLTRTNKDDYMFDSLKIQYRDILLKIKDLQTKQMENNNELKQYIIILFKIIAYTRDIISGKGEYNLSYMLLNEWCDIMGEDLAKFMLRYFVTNDDGEHPFGSWKDIKYLCNYLVENKKEDSILIDESINLMNKQLRQDEVNFREGNNISLAAKWAPREKSNKFGLLFTLLACDYYSEYLSAPKESHSYKKGILKCKTQYRKLLSSLNKHIDTLQIKQCAHNWASIDFNNVTSISLSKQKQAFLNKNKDGTERCKFNSDRQICAENFKQFIITTKNEGKSIKGKRLSMVDFTKNAINLINELSNNCERDLLNMQWKDNSTLTEPLGKMIAMVDVSGSMDGDPLMAAIALGIRIAEKSILGKRIMTFSAIPSWVNLDDCDDFVSMVYKVKEANWNMNTNFYAALDLILNSIVENKLSPESVEDLVLVILSDMQMDMADRDYTSKSLYDVIKMKYAEAGIRVFGKPYNPPHILFWNLRATNGFPCLSKQANSSMMSGFNPALLTNFSEEGIQALEKCTPWYVFMKNINNERYKILEEKARELL